MKKVLATGGAEFVGSRLCKYLLKRGNEVICVDNFLLGKGAISEKNYKMAAEDYAWHGSRKYN